MLHSLMVLAKKSDFLSMSLWCIVCLHDCVCVCGLVRVLQSKGPAFDTSFWLYQRRRQIKQEDKSSNVATMSVVTRIKFETAKVNSDKSVMAAMEKQVCIRVQGARAACSWLL